MKALKQICFVVPLLLGIFSCAHYPDDTIVLLGPEGYVKTANELAHKYMLEDSLANMMFHLNLAPNGDYPPDIEGEYKISEKQFVQSNFHDLDDHHLDMYLKVERQHNRIASVYLCEGNTVFTDTAYVTGQDPWFSLYFEELKEMVFQGSTHVYHRLVLITGKKTDEGIENLYFGNLILDADEGADPLMGSYLPGWYFVYKDKDGLSENSDWFDNQ